jgi:ankyrin repeat protein
MRRTVIALLLAVLVPLVIFAQVQRQLDEEERQEPELLMAAKSGDINKVRSLLERPGEDVNAKTPNGVTALMLAAGNGHVNKKNENRPAVVFLLCLRDHLVARCSLYSDSRAHVSNLR